MGDTYKALKKIKEAVACFNIALDKKDKFYLTALEWRALLYFSNGDFHESLTDFLKIIKITDKSIDSLERIKAYYYTGKIYFKLWKLNDAILNFEQVVKLSNDIFFIGNALYEIAKIKINEKDFYEAFFTLEWAIDKNFKSQRLQLYKDFTEGVLQLIKWSGEKGVETLTSLLSHIQELKNSWSTSWTSSDNMRSSLEYLNEKALIYWSYGYLFVGDYK